MLTRRLYYFLKPYLPLPFRLHLRRIIARQKLRKHGDVWPIDVTAGSTPAKWPGWPEGKRFAFVLTHDVESRQGLARCRQLMKLESEFGFRSSFNFIPEGEYVVLRQLREELVRDGFEVGVHDLYHDGKLYHSRRAFLEKAQRINHYLKEWGATGFRSGFMLREADWLHELNIEYDASTFDTDPFEPQPDGVETIFPFWVPGPMSRKSEISYNAQPSTQRQGYVEMPYTLVQDFTLFMLLSVDQPDFWFLKLDWIAKNGGMALVNVHPDYLNLDKSHRRGTYAGEKYAALLKYVSEQYSGEFWHTTPAQLARWYRETVVDGIGKRLQTTVMLGERAASPRAIHHRPTFVGKRAAVLLYSYYASDPRPRRAAEALKRAGMEVDVLCLRRPTSKAWGDCLNGVNVFRVPLRRRRSSKLTYIIQYFAFLLVSFFILSVWRLRRRYHLVHVHNMPDALVFGALPPRLFGAKVILDLHDPMPELFSSIYDLAATHPLSWVLKKLEKSSIAFADLVLTPNQAFKEVFTSRGCPAEKLQIIMNTPQEEIFNPFISASPSKEARKGQPFILMYHGLLVERHGLDLAIRAIAQLRARIPPIEFHVYGEPTAYFNSVMRLVRELELEPVVRYHGFKPLEEIAQAISIADVGLIPNRLNAFTRINLPTRVFEYLAMGKPVIVPKTKGICDYFHDQQIIYFEPGNIEDLADKIEWAYSHPTETRELVQNALQVYRRHRWESEEQRFLSHVEDLLRNKAHASAARRLPERL